VFANLELQPEIGHNANIGPRLELHRTPIGDVTVEINAFLRDADRLIVLLGNDRFFSYQNVYKSRGVGLENALSWESPGGYVNVEGMLTWQDVRNRSDEGTFRDFEGDRIPNRPYLFGSWGAWGRIPNLPGRDDTLEPFYHGRYVHEFFRSWESQGLRSSKQVVATQVTHSVGAVWSLSGEVVGGSVTFEFDSLTDAKVYDNYGVQRPGRGYQAHRPALIPAMHVWRARTRVNRYSLRQMGSTWSGLATAFACVFAASSVAPLPARADSSTALPVSAAVPLERVQRLELALQELSEAGATDATWGAIANVVFGSAWAALGAWVLIAHNDADEDPSSIEVGTVTLATGGSLLAAGLYGLGVPPTTDRRRLERWNTLRGQGTLDAIELARFEGELAAEADAARRSRVVSGVSHIGAATGGAAVIALAAAGQVAEGSRWFAYVMGGSMVAVGVGQALADLCGSSATEDIWQRYRSSLRNASVSFGASPNGAQLHLSGRF
jgi:hypothetical protein